MSSPHSFPSFEKELNRLVATFEKNFAHYKKAGYDEASLRQEFLRAHPESGFSYCLGRRLSIRRDIQT
jgi:hypothetical protein